MSVFSRLKARLDRFFDLRDADLSTAEGVSAARRVFFWRDHHFLRVWWTNFASVAPGVWRSNQPDETRFAVYAQQGIRSVLNLRGVSRAPFHWITTEGCHAAGLTLYTIALSATKAPTRDAMLAVFDVFDKAERDLLIHCKSGADRTGLVSVFYLVDQCNESLASARRHLSLRYVHIRWSKAGILDLLLDDFARIEGKKSLRDWLRDDYDGEDLTRRFASRRR